MSALVSAAVVISSAISAGTQLHSANIAKKDAESLRQNQERQAKLQERLSVAREKRAARIRTAQLQGVAGTSGIGGTSIVGALTGIQTGTQAQTELISQQTGLQIEQFGIQQAQTVNEANLAIGQAIGSFVSSVGTAAERKPK